jgi:hypothetical protein
VGCGHIVENFAAIGSPAARLVHSLADSRLVYLSLTANRVRFQNPARVQVRSHPRSLKYETDQDFHVILRTDPSVGSKTFFNAEISGLPANSATAFARLQDARNSLAVVLDNELPSSSVDATIDAFARQEDVPLGYWSIPVVDTFDEGGQHRDRKNQPFALVAAAKLADRRQP